MERKKKIQFNNQTIEVTEVPFTTGGEYWNEYLLDDGSVLKLKIVATEILRVDGQFDADGNPQYVVRSTNIVSVSGSERLRKQPPQ